MAGTKPLFCSTGVVALEGLDGCGTTTQAKLLAERIIREGNAATLTQEPSSGYVGRLLREALSTSQEQSTETFPAFLALLFAADRLEHLDSKVRPALKRGEWVITDRSVLSSLAYQSMELSSAWVESINSLAPFPHLILWVDTPPEECILRIEGRKEAKDRYEKLETLKELHPLYASLSNRDFEGVKIIRIDGEQSIQEVHEKIWQEFRLFFGY